MLSRTLDSPRSREISPHSRAIRHQAAAFHFAVPLFRFFADSREIAHGRSLTGDRSREIAGSLRNMFNADVFCDGLYDLWEMKQESVEFCIPQVPATRQPLTTRHPHSQPPPPDTCRLALLLLHHPDPAGAALAGGATDPGEGKREQRAGGRRGPEGDDSG